MDGDQTMSIVEAQESIQVTAVSAALSRFDNDAAPPEEDSTPEEAHAQVSGSASENPRPRAPDSNDLRCRGRSLATVSKREKRRLRLEENRRAIERMLEDKLKAGSFSLRAILTSAVTLQPSGRRGL